MSPSSFLLFRRARTATFALAALAVLALGACSDDDGGTSNTTTPPAGLGDGATDTGNPVSDGVTFEITGHVEQTFRGGACSVNEGYLQITAGFASGIGPMRPQGSPYANGTVTFIAQAEEGDSDESILNLVLESDGTFVLAETPAITVDPGLATGTFESDQVSGSWSCPQVLTAEQLQDLVADYANE